MIKQWLATVITLLIGFFVFAQEPLKNIRKSGIEDTAFINRLNAASENLMPEKNDSALQVSRIALNQSRSIQYSKGEMYAIRNIANANYHLSNFSLSVLQFDSLFALSEANNNAEGIIYSHIGKGRVLVQQGQLDTALNELLIALRLSEKEKMPRLVAKANMNIGNVYSIQEDHKTAIGYYQKVLAFAQKSFDSVLIGDCYTNIGNENEKSDETDSALAYYNLAKSLYERLNNLPGLASSYNHLGLVLRDQDKLDEAIRSYNHCIDLRIKLNDKRGLASVYINLGSAYSAQKKFEKAAATYDSALQIANTLHLQESKRMIYKNVSNMYSSKGDLENALKYYKRFSAIKDSMLSESKAKAMAEMQTKYETEKKEQQNQILTLQVLRRSRERNAVLIGLMVIALIGILVSGYFRQRAVINKKNVVIQQQKVDDLLKDSELKTYNAMMDGQEEERKRIASDLHDRLGSMLATVKMHFNSLEEKVENYQLQNSAQYEKANKLLDEACDEVRRISHNMSTGMLMQFGLQSALNELMETIESTGYIKTRLLMYGISERLNQQTEIGIYRIIQECVSNILKHAQAKNVTVQLNKTNDHLNITIEDDGVGFNVNEKMKSGGMGLKNISARAEKLNGKFTIDSTPGKGTTSIIEIPVHKESV